MQDPSRGGVDAGNTPAPPSAVPFVHPLTRGEIAFGLTAIIDAHRGGSATGDEKGALKSFFLQHARLINSIFLETQDEYGPHPRLFMAVIRHLKDGTPVSETLGGAGTTAGGRSDDARARRRKRRRQPRRDEPRAGGVRSSLPPGQLPPHPRQLEKQRRAQSLLHVRLFQHLLCLCQADGVSKPDFGSIDPVPLQTGPRMSIADNVAVIKAASARSIALMKEGRRVIVVGETLDQAVAGSLFLEPDGANFCFVSDDDPSNGVVQIPTALVSGVAINANPAPAGNGDGSPAGCLMLGIAFSRDIADGEAVFLVGGSPRSTQHRGSASEITEAVSQFRFITLTEADAITWIIGITTVVAAFASKEDKEVAQPRTRTVWQAARAQLLTLTPHIGIAPASASSGGDSASGAAAGRGPAPSSGDMTCWLPFTMHR